MCPSLRDQYSLHESNTSIPIIFFFDRNIKYLVYYETRVLTALHTNPFIPFNISTAATKIGKKGNYLPIYADLCSAAMLTGKNKYTAQQ